MILDNSTTKAQEYYTYPRKLENYKWFKPILTMLLTAVFYVIFIGVLTAISMLLVSGSGSDPKDFIEAMSGGYDTMDVYSAPGALASLGTLGVFIPALFLAIKITKERPIASIHSSRGGWNNRFFTRAILIALVVNALPQIIIAAVEGGFKNFEIRYTVAGFIVFLIFLPLQCMAEEYAFRGFIGQTLGAWFKNPVVPIIVSTICFMVLHGYNGIGQFGIFVSGLVFAMGAWYTKGLEVGCASHIVNNWFTFFLSGIGVSRTTADVDIPGLIVDIAVNLAFIAGVIILDKKFHWFSEE
ncbi:MAG: CPBP family intramembrane metalloprotease [Lachnospiraceae bacterium]|nr:CPBP family intramembrane metalloprotease [Lachnospiraceae bacterium]